MVTVKLRPITWLELCLICLVHLWTTGASIEQSGGNLTTQEPSNLMKVANESTANGEELVTLLSGISSSSTGDPNHSPVTVSNTTEEDKFTSAEEHINNGRLDTTTPDGQSSNITGTTQMSDSEAMGAMTYVIIFLVMYTSSIGMLILYNVNHHKKISENEEIKRSEKELQKSKQLIELQQREELYMYYKMLYGQESGTATPTTEEAQQTPDMRKNRAKSKRKFSIREIPIYSSLQWSRPKLPVVSESPTQRGTLPKRFRFRPQLRRENSLPVSYERNNMDSKHGSQQFNLDVTNDDENKLSTQTWHPSSMTRNEQQMLANIQKKVRGTSEPEDTRVIDLQKCPKVNQKGASTEEVESLL